MPMQLSTSVGAAATRYSVPPKSVSHASIYNTSSTAAVGNTNSSVECMIVEGYVCGHKARILIDSGAKMSHISSSFVDKHQLRTCAPPIPAVLVMADGHKQVAERIVNNADLQLDTSVESVDMLVMDMTHYDVILGM